MKYKHTDLTSSWPCVRCDGSGRLWHVAAKEWPYGHSEPASRPVPDKCYTCEGTGVQNVSYHRIEFGDDPPVVVLT